MSTQRPNQALICRTPTHPLANFVERLWLLSDAPAQSKERIAPSGRLICRSIFTRTNFGFTIPQNPSDADAFQEPSFAGLISDLT
jgi:hypothetical protein